MSQFTGRFLRVGAGATAIVLLTGCATQARQDTLTGTPFANGGISKRSGVLVAQWEAAKGVQDVDKVNTQLELDFGSVVTQCKNSLESNDSRLREAQNWALTVSIIGLLAGVGGAAFAAKAAASKSTLAALSGIAGGSNTLQNQLRENGRDPVEYSKRSTTIRDGILKNTKIFQGTADPAVKQEALRDLVSICVAYS